MRNLLLAALLGAAVPAGAAEVEPIIRAQLLGGQHFVGSERGALAGNLSFLAAPAVRFNGRWALLPTFSSAYQGTRRVVDLLGAGTLFQEQMDHRVSLKAVHSPEGSLWRWKAGLGCRMELLKETTDERWTRGLFDYQALEAGAEAEYVYRDPFSLRLTYDYAYTFFPNYRSLESQTAGDFTGQPLSRELAGDRVLDTYANMLGAAFDLPFGDASSAQLSVRETQTLYPRQPIVEESGLFSTDKRADYRTDLSASLRSPVELGLDLRAVLAGSLSAASLISNQNSYDARRTRFLSQYYNYLQVGVGGSVRIDWGDERQPVSAALSLALSRRTYPHRSVQDASGTYQGETLRQNTWSLGADLRYPMAPHFALLFELEHGRTTSNYGYAQFYRYDYAATDYLFGLQYEY
ncbi:MAG: hypothetical protein WC969_09850 [Elusimicrobiota bacterium]